MMPNTGGRKVPRENPHIHRENMRNEPRPGYKPGRFYSKATALTAVKGFKYKSRAIHSRSSP